MTPIISREEQDTILTSEISNNHLVVAVIDGSPKILTRADFDSGCFNFRNIKIQFVNGNSC